MAEVKVKRNTVVAFLNTGTQYDIMGKRMAELSYAYNPNVSTEQYIVNNNSSSSVNGYAIQLDGSQIAYKGEAVFDYINSLRKTLATDSDAEGKILLVDVFDSNYSQEFDCAIAITSFGGAGSDPTKIEYSVYLNGDPKIGTSVITDGVAVFTETPASL